MKQWFCLFSTWHRGTGRSPVGSLHAAQTLALFERFSTGQPEPVAPKKSAETEEGLLLPLPKEEEDEEGLLSPAQSAGEENRGFLPPRQSTDERGSLPPAQSADKDQQGFLQPVPRAGDQEGAFLPPADKDQLGFLPPNSRAAEGVLPPVSGDSKYVGCLLASSRGAAEEKTGSLPPDLRGRALNIILQTDGTGMHVLQNLLPVLAGLSRPRVKMKIALSFLRLLKCNLKPGIQLPFRLLHLNLLSCRKALNVVKLGPQQLSIPACVHTLSLHLKILQEQILQFLEEKEGLMLVPWQIMLFFMKKHYPLAVPGISILGNLLHLGEKRPHRFFTAWSETYGPIMRLNNSMYILVGTPGRVLDLATRVVCNLEGCGMLAMDEADKLLSPEYLPITTQLIRLLPAGLQSLLFSANFTVNVKSFKDKYIKSPYSINLMEEMTLKEITQYYAFVEEKHKVHCLNTLFSKLQINQSVIFCNSVERIKLLAKKITDLRYSCFYIHAKMAQVHGNKVFQYTIETRADSLMVINSGELAVLASAYMDGPCQATELQFTLQAHQTAAASAHALSQFLPSLLYQMEPRGQYFQSPKYEEPTGDSHASMEHATYSQLNCKQPVIQSGFYLDVLYFSFPLRLRGSIGYQAHDKAEGWNLHRLIFILLNFLNKDLLDPGIASMHFMM